MYEERSKGEKKSFLREHPGMFFTLSYVFLSIMGIVYNFSLYAKFGLNIFDFIEINDFLVGAFKQPITFVVMGSLLLITGIGIFRTRSSLEQNVEQIPLMGKLISPHILSFLRILFVLFIVIVLFSVPYFLGKVDAKKNLEGRSKQIIYTTKDNPTNIKDSDSIYLIGSTEKFFFFYHKNENKTKVVNVTNLIQIETIE